MTRGVRRLKKPATEDKQWDVLGDRGDRGHLYVPLPTKVQRTSQGKKCRKEEAEDGKECCEILSSRLDMVRLPVQEQAI